jgi:hypothetical protein
MEADHSAMMQARSAQWVDSGLQRVFVNFAGH